jgi:hypothetical protein
MNYSQCRDSDAYLLSFNYPLMQACVSYLSAMILLFLHLRVADNSEFHSSTKAFGNMSPHCRFSDLGPFRLIIFSAQVGNWTRAHGDESNPLEISMSSAMKDKPGLATGLTTLGALHLFIRAWKSDHQNLCQARIEPARAPSASYCSTEGVAPLHTAPPVPVEEQNMPKSFFNLHKK